jgi:hypothetical protein
MKEDNTEVIEEDINEDMIEHMIEIMITEIIDMRILGIPATPVITLMAHLQPIQT